MLCFQSSIPSTFSSPIIWKLSSFQDGGLTCIYNCCSYHNSIDSLFSSPWSKLGSHKWSQHSAVLSSFCYSYFNLAIFSSIFFDFNLEIYKFFDSFKIVLLDIALHQVLCLIGQNVSSSLTLLTILFFIVFSSFIMLLLLKHHHRRARKARQNNYHF